MPDTQDFSNVDDCKHDLVWWVLWSFVLCTCRLEIGFLAILTATSRSACLMYSTVSLTLTFTFMSSSGVVLLYNKPNS